eukprot:12918831-Prorocentrum_lima.AAC.1
MPKEPLQPSLQTKNSGSQRSPPCHKRLNQISAISGHQWLVLRLERFEEKMVGKVGYDKEVQGSTMV